MTIKKNSSFLYINYRPGTIVGIVPVLCISYNSHSNPKKYILLSLFYMKGYKSVEGFFQVHITNGFQSFYLALPHHIYCISVLALPRISMSELGHSGKWQGVQREPSCVEVGSYTLSFYKQQSTGHLRK